MVIFAIIVISVIIFALFIIHSEINDSPLCIVTSLFSAFLGIFCYVYALENNNKEPQAIDVYRGNTTLKISYVDSVATDSVVVFKNKK